MINSPFFDVASVAAIAEERVRAAVLTWAEDTEDSEPTFANRFSDHFRYDWACSQGDETRYVKCRLARLHRQGRRFKDKFGSDLGITIDAEEFNFLKTAIFQAKVIEDGKVKLRKDQLDEAKKNPLLHGRSYVAALDKATGTIRIRDAVELANDFPADQDTHKFDVDEWPTLAEWMSGWLDGSIGEASAVGDPHSLEAKLKSHYLSPFKAGEFVHWAIQEYDHRNLPLPSRYIQVKVSSTSVS